MKILPSCTLLWVYGQWQRCYVSCLHVVYTSLQEWICEFCGTCTEVDIVEEEKPSKEDTTFLITPAAVEGGGAMGGVSGVDDAMVIFCVDISGSMCVTTEVSTFTCK